MVRGCDGTHGKVEHNNPTWDRCGHMQAAEPVGRGRLDAPRGWRGVCTGNTAPRCIVFGTLRDRKVRRSVGVQKCRQQNV